MVMNSYVIWIDFVVAWKKQAIFKGLDSTIYVLRVEVRHLVRRRD